MCKRANYEIIMHFLRLLHAENNSGNDSGNK